MDKLKVLREVKAHCESVSRGVCSAGGCKYSEPDHGCIFENAGMNMPYEWDLEGGDDNENNN